MTCRRDRPAERIAGLFFVVDNTSAAWYDDGIKTY